MSDTIEHAAMTGGEEIRRIVYSEEEIRERVAAMGAAITEHYPAEEELLVLGLLKGSFVFLADLVRRIRRPLMVDFLVASSYGAGTVSSGNVRLVYDPEADFRGRHVLVVEDIVDSGNTLERIMPLLAAREPRSLELCALLHKRLVTLTTEARWVGFEPPSEFLIGYGLDHSENYRNLPFIAAL